MSTFDYAGAKETAIRLVEKFGTICKVENGVKSKSAKVVFMNSKKGSRDDGATVQQSKQVYLTGINLEVNTNERLRIKNDVYLITDLETYNFDNSSKILYVATIAK